MASSGDEVRVPIGIPVETNSRAAAGDVDQLRASIQKSQEAIKDNLATMRSLRGSNDEVKAAKDQLKATVERERQTISAATLGLMKHGTSLEQLARQEKKNKDAQKESKSQFDDVGKSLARAKPKLDEYKDGVKDAGDASKASGAEMDALAIDMATVSAAALAAAAAVGALVVSVGSLLIKGADFKRTLSLVRDASTRNGEDSRNLGDQVDQLASKVPTATGALNDLAASLARARLDGTVTVDALNAVAQANAAVGDSAGAKIREIIERGRLVNRMFVGWQELNGTGLDMSDVAGALADRMHVSVKEAQKALREGRVTLADGAAAMREAVEKKFGGINLKKMMSLDELRDTISKIGAEFTKDIDLEPAAKAVFGFFHSFDQSTASGVAVRKLSTDFGNGIVKLIERGVPIVKQFAQEMTLGALRSDIAITKLHTALLEAEYAIKKPLKDVGMLDAMNKLELGAKTTSAAFLPLTSTITIIDGEITMLTTEIDLCVAALNKIGTTVDNIKKAATTGVGGAIVDGIVDGMKDSEGKLKGGASALAKVIKGAFTGDLEIHSPSRVMRRDIGRPIGQGVQQGIDDTAPDVQSAINDMTRAPRIAAMIGPASSGSGAPAASSGTVVHVHVAQGAFVIHGGSGGDDAKETLRTPGLLQAMTQLFKDVASQAGMTVGTISMEGGT